MTSNHDTPMGSPALTEQAAAGIDSYRKHFFPATGTAEPTETDEPETTMEVDDE